MRECENNEKPRKKGVTKMNGHIHTHTHTSAT